MSNFGQRRFLVDHMLIKLGKYLRILGYDAEWNLALRTHELILQANRETRMFLTRNQKLADQYPKPDSMLVITGEDPVIQLRTVIELTQIDPFVRQFSRCIRCNVLLEAVQDKSQIQAKVHPNVYRQHERFFLCPSCRTVFWHGSHVRNTRRKLGLNSNEE